MIGASGAHAHAHVLAHSRGRDQSVCKGEQMESFATPTLDRFEDAIPWMAMPHLLVVSQIQLRLIACLLHGHHGKSALPHVARDSKAKQGKC